ncbi:MAG: phosphatidylglycerophosphatase A [Erysipelothrix sp.]|nr:phosphatidylglycerophosphatase A [Erysipelothrix sp.]
MQELCIKMLNDRGVTLEDIVECVIYLQAGYNSAINPEETMEDVLSILDKREVQNTIMTGIAIDIAVEQKSFGNEQIRDIIGVDEGLYGIDEVLAYSICNLYGSIALTNFGYIDRVKPGIIGVLNEEHEGRCNTFIDDIVGAIAAAAASKSAHKRRDV